MTVLEQNAYNAIIAMAKKDEPDYWTKLEHQYAGMAMQGILTNPSIELDYKGDEGCIQAVAIVAGKFAHALVEKMRQKEE